MFDDLADPLGPPEGDALSKVLARARRRRVAHRSVAAVTAALAVVVVAVSAGALVNGSSSQRPAVSTGSPSPQPTITSPPPTTPKSTPTTATTGPTVTTVAGRGVWTEPQLTITPRSLGAVRVGMTLAQAQRAAGVTFDDNADGASFPTTLPAGYPHLYTAATATIGGAFGVGPDVACVGAQIGPQGTTQRVVTIEGFRLGDTGQHLKAIYGDRAHYVAAPPSGISPNAGYVVMEKDGALAFALDPTTDRIFEIKGGPSAVTPSNCNG